MLTVCSIVESEFDVVKVAAVPDDDEHARHRSGLLDLTLRRPLRTRDGAGVIVVPQEEAIKSRICNLKRCSTLIGRSQFFDTCVLSIP